jgi:hypothetical protein
MAAQWPAMLRHAMRPLYGEIKPSHQNYHSQQAVPPPLAQRLAEWDLCVGAPLGCHGPEKRPPSCTATDNTIINNNIRNTYNCNTSTGTGACIIMNIISDASTSMAEGQGVQEQGAELALAQALVLISQSVTLPVFSCKDDSARAD